MDKLSSVLCVPTGQSWAILSCEYRPVETYFESHEFVIRTRCPGVDLDAVTQGNDEELDLFIFDDFEVNGSLQIANIDPAVSFFDILVANALGAQNLGLEPREVVNADTVLLARHSDEDVLTFEYFHLLESPT